MAIPVITEVPSKADSGEIVAYLAEQAKKVYPNAYPCASSYQVASAMSFLYGGRRWCVVGVNTEEMSGNGTHAEENAISTAITAVGRKNFVPDYLVVVSQGGQALPCGHCRQNLVDFTEDAHIYTYDEKGARVGEPDTLKNIYLRIFGYPILEGAIPIDQGISPTPQMTLITEMADTTDAVKFLTAKAREVFPQSLAPLTKTTEASALSFYKEGKRWCVVGVKVEQSTMKTFGAPSNALDTAITAMGAIQLDLCVIITKLGDQMPNGHCRERFWEFNDGGMRFHSADPEGTIKGESMTLAQLFPKPSRKSSQT